MNDVVIDASVALRWAFADEADQEGAVHVAEALAQGRLRAVVPPTFLAEVAGVLVRARRAGRIERAEAEGVLAALTRVQVDADEPHDYASMAMSLAMTHSIHLQDAMYLETARRTRSPLVSADQAQLRAANEAGLPSISLADVPAWTLDPP